MIHWCSSGAKLDSRSVSSCFPKKKKKWTGRNPRHSEAVRRNQMEGARQKSEESADEEVLPSLDTEDMLCSLSTVAVSFF